MERINPYGVLQGTRLFGALFLVLSLMMPVAATSGEAPNLSTAIAQVAKQNIPAVVHIEVTQRQEVANPLLPFENDPFFRYFFNLPRMPRKFKRELRGLGTGMIMDQQGNILTNNHVVGGAREIQVWLADGTKYPATFVGTDPKTDLAVIRITAKDPLPQVIFGDSDLVEVGEWVVAIGHPRGLDQTVTQGIISAKHRGGITDPSSYQDFLQTDAAINPGNSGGPLFNMNGEVIGINTAIVAQGQGIGFAIPINIAKALLPQLKTGKITRGWLGLMIQDLTPELAKSFNIKETKGVLVSNVMPDSPAAKAGLEQGDVVVRFNGKAVENSRELSQMAAATTPNTPVKIDIIRNGTPKTIEVSVGTMPEEGQAAVPQAEKNKWGMTVQQLTPELAQHLGFDSSAKGVVISAVDPGSSADNGGLRPGDLIVEANRHKVEDIQDYQKAIKGVKPGENLLLLVQRDSGTFFVVLQSPQNQ
jgi:serine protease Do